MENQTHSDVKQEKHSYLWYWVAGIFLFLVVIGMFGEDSSPTITTPEPPELDTKKDSTSTAPASDSVESSDTEEYGSTLGECLEKASAWFADAKQTALSVIEDEASRGFYDNYDQNKETDHVISSLENEFAEYKKGVQGAFLADLINNSFNMSKWEYKIVTPELEKHWGQRRVSSTTTGLLNELGDSGWELVSVTPLAGTEFTFSGQTTNFVFIFKRLAHVSAEVSVGREEDVDDTLYNVILQDPGTQQIAVIKVIKEICDLDLKEAKEVVETTPSVVKEGLKREEAGHLRREIALAGGSAEVTAATE